MTVAKAGPKSTSITKQPEYKLTQVEKKGEKLDHRVTKMKLGKL